MEIWDPHFHIWDISKNTKSEHDASQLFEPNDKPVYSWREYEHDIFQAGSSFSHTGGVFVEVASVCHTKLSGAPFAKACLAETNWGSSQLEQSQKQYVMVSSAPLEDPEIGAGRWLFLHMVQTVGAVHAVLLRVQALIWPIQTLVFSGH